MADATLEFAGSIDLLPEISDTDFYVDLDMPWPSSLFAMAGIGVPEYSIKVTGGIQAVPGRVEAPDLVAQLGRTDLEGRIFYSTLETIPRLEMDIRSRLVDQEQLTEQRVAQEETGTRPNDGRVIPDIDLPLEALRSMNAIIQLDAERWVNETF